MTGRGFRVSVKATMLTGWHVGRLRGNSTSYIMGGGTDSLSSSPSPSSLALSTFPSPSCNTASEEVRCFRCVKD